MGDGSDVSADNLPEGVSAPDGAHLPPIPQPGRRAAEAEVPFDPAAFAILRTLEEVERKPDPPQGVATAGQIADARRKSKFIPKFSSLESMYAANPMLVTSGKLRIERVQPQWYDDEWGGKMRVNGILAFKHPIIDDQEFAQKFGGFKYRVFGLLDQENRENFGGPPKSTEVGVAEMDIPLPPNIMNLPIADAVGVPTNQPGAMVDMYSPYGRRPGAPIPFPGQGGAPDPYGPMLSFAERAMNSRSEGLPPQAWDVIGRQSENAVNTIRDSASAQTQMLVNQIERLEHQLENERQAAREALNRPTDINQMVDGMSRLVASTKGNTDSDVIRQMRDDHDRVTRQMQNDHETAMARLREEQERTTARLKDEVERTVAKEREYGELRLRAAESRVKDLENSLALREQEWRNEAERRESRARAEMTQLMEMREREHERATKVMEDAHAREMQNVRDMHERELRTHQTVHDTTKSTGEQAHAMEMRSLQTDLAKVSAELEEKRRLVRQYEAEKNKPFLEQLREHKETIDEVREIAGAGDEGPSEGPPEGEEKWWNSPLAKQVAGALVTEGMKHAPAFAEKMSSMARPASAAKMTPGPAAPRQMPAPMHRPGGLPPRRSTRVQFADSEGPRFVSAADSLPRPDRQGDVSHIRSGSPKPFDVGSPSEDGDDIFAPASAPEPTRQSAPRPQRPARPAPKPQRPVEPETQQQPAPATAPDSASSWTEFAWMPMPPSDIENFIQQMDFALQNGGTAEQLGKAFLDNYPPQDVRALITAIDIKRFIQSLRDCPATSGLALAQGKGRRFLADTWAYLDAALSQQQPASPPSQPPQPQAGEDTSDADLQEEID